MSAPTVEPPAVDAAPKQHTGAMIALIPTDDDCARLAIDGYEPAHVLHTTLVFLGEAADWDKQSRDILEGTIRELETARALRGDVWAHAQFNPAGDDPCAVYLVGAPGIEDIHSAVLGAVEENTDWFPQIPDQHTPWIPHITAGYGLPAGTLTDVGPVTFDRVRLSFADEDIRDIALTNTSERLVAAAEAGYLDDPAALTASVAAGIPVSPPAEWFNDPQLDAPTPITVTPEGRIFGTLGSWESCHIGFGDSCVPPPKSKTDYAYFCNGLVLTADGTDVHTGRITMGTGHAGLRLKPRVAAAHYDDTGTCVADVTAGEDAHGIWVAGAIRPGTTDEQLRALRASPLSGDWREINGNLELVAALAVNVPGFNIPRPKTLAASGHRALTAAGIVPVDYRKTEISSAPATPEDRAAAQYFSAPELTASIAREVRAARTRETASEALAARIRTVRVDAATRRISLAASGATTPPRPANARLKNLLERMDALTAAAPKTDDQKAKPLERYWTKGKGLARWAESPTPFRTLVKELRKEIPADEMTPQQINGLAATYYKKAKGEWPGKKRGDKRGSRVASLVARMNTLTAAGRHRRVETPEGAERYGQPVGSLIVPDVPDAPKPKASGGSSSKKAEPREKLPKGFERKYKSDDIDGLTTKDAYGFAAAFTSWDANSKSDYSDDGTMDGDLADYDLPATANDLIRQGINAAFLHTGVGPGGEWEIGDDGSPDSEWNQLGGIINEALLRNRRDEPRPTDPEVFGESLDVRTMSNSDLINLFADVSVLTDGDLDTESERELVRLAARSGLNVRAGLDDSAATPEVRAEIRRQLWRLWTED